MVLCRSTLSLNQIDLCRLRHLIFANLRWPLSISCKPQHRSRRPGFLHQDRLQGRLHRIHPHSHFDQNLGSLPPGDQLWCPPASFLTQYQRACCGVLFLCLQDWQVIR